MTQPGSRRGAYDPHQVFLLPPSIDDWLPEDHLARFVSELVEEILDLEPFLASYTEAGGFHRMTLG